MLGREFSSRSIYQRREGGSVRTVFPSFPSFPRFASIPVWIGREVPHSDAASSWWQVHPKAWGAGSRTLPSLLAQLPQMGHSGCFRPH